MAKIGQINLLEVRLEFAVAKCLEYFVDFRMKTLQICTIYQFHVCASICIF